MSLTQTAALGITLAVEVPLVVLMAYRWRVPWSRSLVVGLLVSCLTHPLAWKVSWWAMVLFQTPHYVRWFIAIETGVVVLEALLFRYLLRVMWQQAFAVSLLANAASALLGVWLWL